MRNFKSYLAVVAALLILSGCKKEPSDGTPELKLSQTETYDFPSEPSSDYPAKTPLTVTVTNKSGKASGKVSISIDGAAASDFNLSKSSIENIAAGGSDTFTVVPVQGLEEGDYKATVHVSARGFAEKSFGVRFVVSEVNIVSITIETLPTKTEYGVGEPIDLTGLVVKATDDGGNTTTLENVEEYLSYDFSVPSAKTTEPPIQIIPTKVQIAVGAAPVKEFDVTVLGLLDRAIKAYGTTATIYVYANEELEDRIYPISATPTEITLTTPEGSTVERVIRRKDSGYFAYLKEASVKLTLDGYVTVKGWATPDYGGGDSHNNNNPLFLLENGSTLEMKGHSRITQTAMVKSAGDGNLTGGGLYINGAKLTVGGDAQITNCWTVKTDNGGVSYGGAFYAVGGSEIRIKENAKLADNHAVHLGGNAYGGVAACESATVYIEGGEISANSARSMAANPASGGSYAGGGAFQIVNGSFRIFMSGGVVKDNYLIYMKAGRGSAFNIGHAKGLTISGSADIPSGGAIVAEGTGGHFKDPGNAISLAESTTSVFPFNIEGSLSTTNKINIDLQQQATDLVLNGLKVMRKRTLVDSEEVIVDFTGDAPADKFTLRNKVRYTSTGFYANPITGYSIGANGTLVANP